MRASKVAPGDVDEQLDAAFIQNVFDPDAQVISQFEAAKEAIDTLMDILVGYSDTFVVNAHGHSGDNPHISVSVFTSAKGEA